MSINFTEASPIMQAHANSENDPSDMAAMANAVIDMVSTGHYASCSPLSAYDATLAVQVEQQLHINTSNLNFEADARTFQASIQGFSRAERGILLSHWSGHHHQAVSTSYRRLLGMGATSCTPTTSATPTGGRLAPLVCPSDAPPGSTVVGGRCVAPVDHGGQTPDRPMSAAGGAVVAVLAIATLGGLAYGGRRLWNSRAEYRRAVETNAEVATLMRRIERETLGGQDMSLLSTEAITSFNGLVNRNRRVLEQAATNEEAAITPGSFSYLSDLMRSGSAPIERLLGGFTRDASGTVTGLNNGSLAAAMRARNFNQIPSHYYMGALAEIDNVIASTSDNTIRAHLRTFKDDLTHLMALRACRGILNGDRDFLRMGLSELAENRATAIRNSAWSRGSTRMIPPSTPAP